MDPGFYIIAYVEFAELNKFNDCASQSGNTRMLTCESLHTCHRKTTSVEYPNFLFMFLVPSTREWLFCLSAELKFADNKKSELFLVF